MKIKAHRLRLLILISTIIVFAVILIRNAWVCDDAYITLRTVDNIVNGYGPVWNIGERVQAYTHPLWMLILTLAYAVTHKAFLTTIVVGILVSLAALAIFVIKIASSSKMAIFGALILILSKFFVDYSTSGLENPITHLLLAVFFIYFLFRQPTEKTIGILSFIASLIMLARLDLILLILPALGYCLYRVKTWKSVKYVVLGFLPLIAWELFSFWYYGMLIPNTGYAKLNTGIPQWDLVVQGAHYLEAALRGDRLMVLAIVGAVGYTIWRKGRAGWPVATGIILYIVYVTLCGGCFMGGRFFTGPLFMSVIVMSQYERLLASPSRAATAFIIVLAVGLTTAYSPVYSGPRFGVGNKRGLGYGIDDCRNFYFQQSGLRTASGWQTEPNGHWVNWGKHNRREGPTTIEGGGIGFLGYYSGPETYIVDILALADPFLARFPAVYDNLWRIGHFVRALPEGYMETAVSGDNHIVDPDFAQYYDTLKYVVSGPLWSWHRMATAVRLQLGAYDHLLDGAGDVLLSVHYRELPPFVPDGSPWTIVDVRAIPSKGIKVYLDSLWHADSVAISLDGNDSYRVEFDRGRECLNGVEVPSQSIEDHGTVTHTIAVPDDCREGGFDRLIIRPVEGDNIYAIGHIIPRSASKAGDERM